MSREAYAIVREALTNALRHGGGGTEVTGEAHAHTVALTVSNDLRPGPTGRAGRGLAGMRERAEGVGGSLTWGPDGHRWRVRAVLPREVR